MRALDLYRSRIRKSPMTVLLNCNVITGVQCSRSHSRQVRIEQAAVAALEKVGGRVQQFGSGTRVYFVTNAQVTDADLQHLKRLDNLQTLDLSGEHLTDAGLQHLNGLENLRSLTLWGKQFTDAGLEHLNGLRNLEYLHFGRSEIGDVGLGHLKASG